VSRGERVFAVIQQGPLLSLAARDQRRTALPRDVVDPDDAPAVDDDNDEPAVKKRKIDADVEKAIFAVETEMQTKINELEKGYQKAIKKLKADNKTLSTTKGQALNALKFIRNIPAEAPDTTNLQTNIVGAIDRALLEEIVREMAENIARIVCGSAID
ncbi:hypothetical protein N0V85_006703, partial [Neurospora sp. IMI 360204]